MPADLELQEVAEQNPLLKESRVNQAMIFNSELFSSSLGDYLRCLVKKKLHENRFQPAFFHFPAPPLNSFHSLGKLLYPAKPQILCISSRCKRVGISMATETLIGFENKLHLGFQLPANAGIK